MINVDNRTIFCHDNLGVLEKINTASVDLIYLDPPFNKNRKFVAPVGSNAVGADFSDIFRRADVKDEWLLTIKQDEPDLFEFLNATKSIGKNDYTYCYLSYMSIRLIECARILKDTGNLFLHCDDTMSHYLKVIMDCLFGDHNYRNEVVWNRRQDKHNLATKHYGRGHDIIFWYAKSDKAKYNKQFTEYDEEYVRKFYNKSDANGAYRLCPCANDAGGNRVYEFMGVSRAWRYTEENMQKMYDEGLLVQSSPSSPFNYKKYLKDAQGVPLQDLWMDINSVRAGTGYPTEKPIELLERIIESTTNEGDMVLDPFCGCATTCVAAEKLGRLWIGIDISHKAYELVQRRFEDELGLFGRNFNYQTSPPKRTDGGAEHVTEKYVYVISNPQYPGEFKVGVASDVKKRLGSYQTSDPNRGYKEEYSLLTPHFNKIEGQIHQDFENQHEWVKGKLSDIKNAIIEYHEKGNKGDLI